MKKVKESLVVWVVVKVDEEEEGCGGHIEVLGVYRDRKMAVKESNKVRKNTGCLDIALSKSQYGWRKTGLDSWMCETCCLGNIYLRIKKAVVSE